MSRVAPRGHIELRAYPPNKLRLAPVCWKHPSQKKQIARLHRFRIDPERLRCYWEFNPEFFQSLFRAWATENLCELPFAKVRTAIHVQHLPCDLASFC